MKNQTHPPGDKQSGPDSAPDRSLSRSNEADHPNSGETQKSPKGEHKHPLEWMIFGFVVLTFLATTGAAWYTRRQWITASDSEQRQLRAYVGAVPVGIENFGAPNQDFTLIRRNYGTTPAYDVGLINMGSQIISPGTAFVTPNSPCARPAFSGMFTMFPGMELPYHMEFGHQSGVDDLRIAAGAAQVVYYGTICYDDAFGYPHYTNFCWMFKGKTMSGADAEGCLTHNDSD